MTSSSDDIFAAFGDAAVRASGQPCGNFVFDYETYVEWELLVEMEEAARLRNLASASRAPPEPRVISKKRVRGAYAAPNSEDEDFDLAREAREVTPEMGQAYREDSSTSPEGRLQGCDDNFFGVGSGDAIIKPKGRGRERFIESPGASSCDISPERGLPNPATTPPTTPEEDKTTEPTDLCDLFEACCKPVNAYLKDFEIKRRLSWIDGAPTLADYYDITIDCKRLYVCENSEQFRGAEQLVRFILWYDLEQLDVSREQIAAELTALGGRPETENSVANWCNTIRQQLPIPRQSKIQEDKLRRARAATQAELRDRIAIHLRRQGSTDHKVWKPTAVPFTPNAASREDLAQRFAKRIRANEGGSSSQDVAAAVLPASVCFLPYQPASVFAGTPPPPPPLPLPQL